MSVRTGFMVVGCVLVGFVTSAGPGLVARAAEPPRWLEREIAARDSTTFRDAGEAQRRIAELEQRLKVEAERRAATSEGTTRGKSASELEAVLARNQELTARNRALAAENQALAQSHLFEPPAKASACEPPPGDPNPKAQLRYWAERLRDGEGGFHNRLTTEQNGALNVLLRRERTLDPKNPWREL